MPRTTLLAAIFVVTCSCEPGDPLRSLAPRLAAPLELNVGAALVGASLEAIVVVANRGGAPANGVVADLLGESFSLVDGPPSTLAPGAAANIRVRFAPTAPGAAAATLTVRGDPPAAPVIVTLTATAAPRPACDDGEPCTKDDADSTGACRHTPRAGSCDDGSACTAADACFAGRCVGDAIACEPPEWCFVGLCDATAGCTFVVDEAACDDGDPCTVEGCAAGVGCTHATAPDGTACGDAQQCGTVDVCFSGACTELVIPDGTPCSDNDACTTGDRCSAGTCAGDARTGPAVVVGAAPTFGAAGAFGVVLDDGRVLLLDPLSEAGPVRATVLAQNGERVAVVGQALVIELDTPVRAAADALPGGLAAVLEGDGDLHVIEVGADGAPRRIGGAAGIVPWAGMGPGVVVAFGDVWYACALGGDALVVLDATSRTTPVPTGELPLPGGCLHLDVDFDHALLLASTSAPWGEPGGGIVRFDLTAPTAPVERDRALDGRSVVAVTDGTIVALVDGSPWSADPYVELRDAATLVLRARYAMHGDVSLSPSFAGAAFGDLVLVDDRLYVQARDRLAILDVADPEVPYEVANVPRSNLPNASSIPPRHAISTNGAVLLRAADGFGGAPLLMDVAVAVPRELRHPARGDVRDLVKIGDDIVALSRTAIHALDVDLAAAPAWTAGGVLPAVPMDAVLWDLGSGQRRLVAEMNDVFTGAYFAVVVDGADPDAVALLNAPFTPFSGGVVHTADDDARTVGLVLGWDDGTVRVVVVDPQAAPPAMGAGLTVTGSVDLAAAPNLDPSLGAVDVRADRAAVAIVDRLVDPFDAAVVGTSTVALLDVLDESAPLVLGTAHISGTVVSVAVDDHGALIAVVRTAGGRCCGSFIGDDIQRFVLAGGALQRVGTASLPASGSVVGVAHGTALVATATGVAFVALAGAPTVVDELPLLEPPTAVLAVGDRVLLGGEHGVVVVDPPCAAP